MDDLLDPVLISAPANAHQFIAFDITAHSSEIFMAGFKQYCKVVDVALDYAHSLGYFDVRYVGTKASLYDSPSGRCYCTTFTFEAM